MRRYFLEQIQQGEDCLSRGTNLFLFIQIFGKYIIGILR